MRRTSLVAAILSTAAALTTACGDDLPPLEGPRAADPALERGCRPVDDAPPPFSRAKRVACAEELPAGVLVGGRVGDVLLENDRVQLVLRASGGGYLFPGTPAGGLIDAAPRGGEDQLKELFPIVDLNMARAEQIALIEAGDDGPATVVVRGRGTPVPLIEAALGIRPVEAVIETHYLLEPGDAHVTIRTFVSRIDDSAAGGGEVEVGDAFFFGGRVSTFMPGFGSVEDRVVNGPIIASAGTDTTSYGFSAVAGAPDLQLLDVANVSAAMAGRARVGSGDPVERLLLVGDGSVSSVTGLALRLRGEETGHVRGTTSRAAGEGVPWIDVLIEDAGGAPVTMARAQRGTFELDLPPGDYTARAVAAGHAAADPIPVVAGGDPVILPVGGSGVLALTARDTEGRDLPARVVVRGADGERTAYTGADGELLLPLAPGSYELDVSRGVEYDAFSATGIEIEDGRHTAVDAVLERVVDTAGWIAVDSHLHSEMSPDSRIPLTDRLRAVAGEGVELAISTDHDFVLDLRPLVAELGLDAWLAYRTGCEVSSLLWGHVNAWPLVPDPDRAGAGAIAWYGKSPGQVFDEMRDAGDGVLIQINHPRRSDSGLLEAIEFDPDTGMATLDPADLGLEGADLNDFDFDAIEVPGKGSPFPETFADWLALVAMGHPVTATGSSDSHGVNQFAGSSRTYVWVGEGADDPSTLDIDQVNAAIRDRRAVVSQGAFVTASIEDPASGEPAAPGEVVDLAGQTTARIHVRVQAPPWMPLAAVRIYAGREEAESLALDPEDTAAVRFDEVVEIPLDGEAGDSFFVVRVDPAGPGTPVLGAGDASFTNPLMYDEDGDGDWSPRRR